MIWARRWICCGDEKVFPDPVGPISNILDLDISTIKSDVFSFLERNKSSYDIIFADPPYDLGQDQFEKIIELIFENELLEEEGMLIVEHSKHTKLDHMMNFSFAKNYGGSVFSFYELESDDEESLEDEED